MRQGKGRERFKVSSLTGYQDRQLEFKPTEEFWEQLHTSSTWVRRGCHFQIWALIMCPAWGGGRGLPRQAPPACPSTAGGDSGEKRSWCCHGKASSVCTDTAQARGCRKSSNYSCSCKNKSQKGGDDSTTRWTTRNQKARAVSAQYPDNGICWTSVRLSSTTTTTAGCPRRLCMGWNWIALPNKGEWNFKNSKRRKVMTNLDSILKSRDITLPTKVHLVKAMGFPVVMYRCESWTIKKAEHGRIDAFALWCWRRLLRVPWTARRSLQSILKKISPEYSFEGLMLKLKLQYFGYLMGRTDSLEKTLMLFNIEGGMRRGPQRMKWLDGITDSMDMNLGRLQSWWWTGKPGVLQSLGSEKVGQYWVTELIWRASFGYRLKTYTTP